jgi:MraZ protein
MKFDRIYLLVEKNGEKGRKLSMNGRANNTMDDKGRITFPSRLKQQFSGDTLKMTSGADTCLWLYPADEWPEIEEQLSSLPATREADKVKRHILGNAVDAEIDKSARIAVPQELRSWAHLSRDCGVMGVGKRIEIWDAAVYDAYMNEGNNIVDSIANLGLRL